MYKIILVILLSVYSFAHSYRGEHTNSTHAVAKSVNPTNNTQTFQKILPKTIGDGYNTILTEHFRIYYGDSNPGSTLWNDVDKNGIADYLDLLKVELEVIWNKEVEDLGFKSPNYGDYIDIFISDTGLVLDGTTLNMGDNVVGYAVYDENNGETYMAVNGGIGYYNGTSGKDLLKITLAHEFFHLIQYAYAHDTYDFNDDNIWLYEGTAVWMEYQVYPLITDYIKTYGDYATSVLTKGMIEEGGIYPYATNYFFDYLVNSSKNTSLIKEIWEKFELNSNSIDAIDETLKKEDKNIYNLLIEYAASLQQEQSDDFTNGKQLFSTLNTGDLFSEYYCNSSKTKTMGYYSVMLFNDENKFDDCNVFKVDSSTKTIQISDGEELLSGIDFNAKSTANGVVMVPTSSISSNSNFYVTFKMQEQTNLDLKEGWNLLGSYSDINLTNLNKNINTIWTYDNNWTLYSNEVDNYGLEKLENIKSGQGFWVSTNSEVLDAFENSFEKSQVCNFDIKDGWNLISSKCIGTLSSLDIISKYSLKSIWRYDDSKWLLKSSSENNYGFDSLENIESNLGYWFYK